MTDMSDKVALVTGASSGIGQATAEAFAARGARVVLAARRETELANVTRGIEAKGGRASYRTVDVSNAAEVEALVKYAVDTFGGLDYAVNNARLTEDAASILDLREDVFDRVMDTNLKGTFLCLQQEARAMAAAGKGGAIVNLGSILSFLDCSHIGAYVATKHALVGLTTSASQELAPDGIRINIVCPGLIDTPMHRQARVSFGDEIFEGFLARRVHARRLGRPEEVAQAILFLCSDEASYITGAAFAIDGGYLRSV